MAQPVHEGPVLLPGTNRLRERFPLASAIGPDVYTNSEYLQRYDFKLRNRPGAEATEYFDYDVRLKHFPQLVRPNHTRAF